MFVVKMNLNSIYIFICNYFKSKSKLPKPVILNFYSDPEKSSESFVNRSFCTPNTCILSEFKQKTKKIVQLKFLFTKRNSHLKERNIKLVVKKISANKFLRIWLFIKLVILTKIKIGGYLLSNVMFLEVMKN